MGYVKCLVCGFVFEEGIKVCPVCGVGAENFVEVEPENNSFKKNTDEKFLILGNGIAGVSAAKAIRERNDTCTIVITGNESYLGYHRPMLTKAMAGGIEEEKILIYGSSWYEEKNILNLTGRTIDFIDSSEKEVHFTDGIRLKYDKCIYALGAECFIPPIEGRDKPEVIAVRRLDDVKKIRALQNRLRQAAVIGGGVLGLEAAWELHKMGCKVEILELADQLMGRQLDEKAGEFLKQLIEKKGINVHLGVKIEAIEGEGHVTGVRLSDGAVLPADLVIISAGVRANIAAAIKSMIETDRAVIVNSKMETSVSDIYACGDCAQYQGINYAIWPEAMEMGETAGANAAGDYKSYQTITAALTFHGMDTSLYAIGDSRKQPGVLYRSHEEFSQEQGIYKKYNFTEEGMAGAVLIGDTKEMEQAGLDIERKVKYEEFKK